jgi:predicted NAD-dependent protein-ADP-ribosyltransferase YbiA (DUF1768 family)
MTTMRNTQLPLTRSPERQHDATMSSSARTSGLDPVYFYRPQQEGTGYLSQWYWSPFRDADGTAYTTAEMYMMVQKARLFDDAETAAQMVATTEPRKHKGLGRAVKGFDARVWDERECAPWLDLT